EIYFILLGFGALLTLFLAVEIFQINAIAGLKKEAKSIAQEKKQYDAILNDIKKMEEEKKTLLTRIDVINKLKQSSSLTVHVLDEIATYTPQGRMWLKKLSQSENQLSIEGMAMDDQTIAKYMDELEGSAYIHDVKLVSSAMEQYAERNLKTFVLSAQVRTPEN
ncbi:MAG: PilN domain-containing protein, partial [Fibrobacter sp.]|nr:PilN domain-containing protein [Fibrobacter sp.]